MPRAWADHSFWERLFVLEPADPRWDWNTVKALAHDDTEFWRAQLQEHAEQSAWLALRDEHASWAKWLPMPLFYFIAGGITLIVCAICAVSGAKLGDARAWAIVLPIAIVGFVSSVAAIAVYVTRSIRRLRAALEQATMIPTPELLGDPKSTSRWRGE